MASREERVAQNEATGKEINEQIQEAHGADQPRATYPIVCECGHRTCEQTIVITPTEYAELRSHPDRFAIIREHTIPDLERMVAGNDRFVVVEKLADEG